MFTMKMIYHDSQVQRSTSLHKGNALRWCVGLHGFEGAAVQLETEGRRGVEEDDRRGHKEGQAQPTWPASNKWRHKSLQDGNGVHRILITPSALLVFLYMTIIINSSIKHDLAKSCFQLWPKIGDERDKITRKNWRGASRDSFFSKFCHPWSRFWGP